MMNDPMVLEASRVLSGKLIQEQSDARKRIENAFRLIVSRHAKDDELLVIENYYQGQLKSLTKDKALALLAVGEYPHAEGIDPIQQAALMQVISMIYNLEETIVKS